MYHLISLEPPFKQMANLTKGFGLQINNYIPQISIATQYLFNTLQSQ